MLKAWAAVLCALLSVTVPAAPLTDAATRALARGVDFYYRFLHTLLDTQ